MDPGALLESFFSQEGPLAACLPGYRARPAQLDMAREVMRALETPGARALIEAGTGTGKSLAYLAPALLSGKKVVIATGTRALQDQLFDKDIPLLARAMESLIGLTPHAALMKGRQNYLCKVRYEAFAAEPRFAFAEDAQAYTQIKSWAEVTERGDRAEIEGLPDRFATWGDLDAGSETCLGGSCPALQDCFITKMRRDAEKADIVVVNHHLLCADVRVRLEGMPASGEGLEEGEDALARSLAHVIPEHDALIVDEAHALADTATEYFGVRVTHRRSERLWSDVKRAISDVDDVTRAPVNRGLAALRDATAAALSFGADQIEGDDGRARLTAKLKSEAGAIAGRAEAAGSDLSGALAHLGDGVDPMSETAASLRSLARRAAELGGEIAFVLDRAVGDASFVAFAEGTGNKGALAAAPIDVGDALSRTLFRTERPVVLTSATLATSAGIGPYATRVGLGENAAGSVFPSPFAYPDQGALYAPAGMPAPDEPGWLERFDDEVRALLTLTGGGALLLFTSHRALDAAIERLGPWLLENGFFPMAQGEAPKGRLLDEMRAAHGRDERAVLLATQSFWEGVDIPGPALRLVVIDRLPFRSPGDPIQQARADLARARGQNPFFDLAVPEAALALKQGVGRLLRSERDAGIVAVLDGRLRKKRYGRAFLDSLPPMLRIGSQKALATFWETRVVPRMEAEDEARDDDDDDDADESETEAQDEVEAKTEPETEGEDEAETDAADIG